MSVIYSIIVIYKIVNIDYNSFSIYEYNISNDYHHLN